MESDVAYIRKAVQIMIACELECRICKQILVSPMYVSCCCQIIGCRLCLNNWLAEDENVSCPMCREPSPVVHEVKGLDNLLDTIRALSI